MAQLDPNEVAMLINLADTLFQVIVGHLKSRGVSDEEISAISDDLRARITRREQESQ